ncbi:Oligopeptide transport system permease protein AppC [Geodia barretti]|uniref:Oligopeptide transport system permease protein AppC n=1 Tax=Geodia barretti TaxID=519541 RepID=A0AA35RT52_GEOBA|nr:Oligopeptide transport system permease protein AppC [Geodia barretti]
MAILANVIAPYHPKESLGRENVHLTPQQGHIMGTDHAGRDVLSRVIHGARISLYVGFGSVAVGITLGFILAVVTTYAGGFIDLCFPEVLTTKELDYILAARAIGASPLRLVFRHITPQLHGDSPGGIHLLPGAGDNHRGFPQLLGAPWVAMFPGLAIFVVVFGFNLLGDSLRDAWDPKLRGR